MKSLTCKQAERWLDKVKESNPPAYKEIGKLLRRYDKYNDEAEIFRKMNEVLLSLPELTEDFNVYLEEGTKFVVNPKNEVKINEFVKFVRKHRNDLLGSIVQMVSRLSNEYQNWSEMPFLDQGRLIKDNLREIVKDDPILNTYFEESFIFEPQEILSKLKLDHLANHNINKHQKMDQQMVIEDISQPQKKVKKDMPPPAPRKQYETEKLKVGQKSKVAPIFINPNQQKVVFKNIQRKISTDMYEQFIKILQLYHLAIITKNQMLSMIAFLPAEDLEIMKDIIESRETDRRKYSVFRPLPDGDFHSLQRSTHSYVRMPNTYPNVCEEREKNKIARQNLNSEWISVPRGTQESFNIRIKNIFEINMIKSEDERYEYDLFKKRLQIGEKVLKKIVAQLEADPTDQKYYHKMLEFIDMNIVQILYKNASKEHKEQFQRYLSSDTLLTLKVMLQRVSTILNQMSDYRKIHGLKIWNDVASKNFFKALDFKTNQFKRIEKIKCKATVFIDQLHSKSSYLQSRGRKKVNRNPFEDKKDFFSIVNSFQNISRREKCVNRSIPTPQTFDLNKAEIPRLLPSMILAFQDTKAIQLSHSFIAFYIDNTVVNQSEKYRCKSLLRRILAKYFQVKEPQSKTTSEKFNEYIFFEMLDNHSISPSVQEWIIDKKPQKTEKYDRMFQRDDKKDVDKKREWIVEHEPPSRYGYLPVKNEKNLVFYSSEHFYVFLRFFYVLYERVIRMKEILQEENKIICFELLYFACIRSKQSVRFEDGLSAILGDHFYIFTTFYKTVQSVCKSLNTLSTCPINSQSLLASNSSNEADYFYRLNRQILQSSLSSGKLVRCVFQLPTKLIYISCIDSLYNTDEANRQLARRRAEITHKIDYYAYVGLLQDQDEKVEKDQADNGSFKEEKNNEIHKELQGQKCQPKEVLIANRSEYCFEGNTIHMLNLPNGQDYVVRKNRKTNGGNTQIQINKNMKLLSKIV